MAETKEAELKELITTVNSELASYSPALVAVTKDVFFDMTKIVERARKNYFGIFDEPQDPITKLDKTFLPLTEATVEGIVKTVDLDTKDILIFPTKPTNIVSVKFLRFIIKRYMSNMDFGQVLNDMLRTMVVDGTAIVKVCKEYDRNQKKKVLTVKIVDRLNFFIDPAAATIQDTSVIERSIFSPHDFEKYKKVWKDTDKAVAVPNLGNTPDVTNIGFSSAPKSASQIEVYERWGVGCKATRLAFEGKEFTEADEEVYEDQVQIFSGQGGNQVSLVHFIGKNPHPKGFKPYEETWYRRMPNRWDGRGVPEQLFGLQEYENQIFNIRKNNALILQNGIFLIRKGSPITPQMISSIYAGGTLPVADIERDIKQLPVQDYRQSSYSDEDRGALWSDRVTGARKADEVMGASTPATIGLIQQQNVRDIFDLIQEGVGFFLERLLKRHLIPAILDEMDNGQILRITGNTKELEELDQLIIDNNLETAKVAYFNEHGFMPEAEDLDAAKKKARKELDSLGNNRFLKFAASAFDPEMDLEIVVTSEKMDKSLVVQALRDVLLASARIPGSNLDADLIIDEIAATLGIRTDFFRKTPDKIAAEQQAMMNQNNPPQSLVGPGPRPNQELPKTMGNPATMMSVANKLPNAGLLR